MIHYGRHTIRNNNVNRYIVIGIILFTMLIQFSVSSLSTTITNKAYVIFHDTISGFNSRLDSNEVRTLLQTASTIVIYGSQDIPAVPGSNLLFSHNISNTGSNAVTFRLSANNIQNNVVNLINIYIFHDTNNDGMLDAGDTSVSAMSDITLQPGKSINILLRASVPYSAPTGVSSQIAIFAIPVDHSSTVFAVDTIHTTVSSTFFVNKSAMPSNPSPNGELTFQLNAVNNGPESATGIPVVVDNAPETLILLSDTIPANTTLSKIENPTQGIILYHLRGDGNGRYVTTPPASFDSIEQIAIGTTKFLANSNLVLSFTVKLHQNANGNIYNTGSLNIFDTNLLRSLTVPSNEIILQVYAPAPALINYYKDPNFNQVAQNTQINNPLNIQISASGCNKDPKVNDIIVVSVKSSKTGDFEIFNAVETGPNTGIFAIIPAIPTRDGNLFLASNGNGIIETIRNDTLTSTFTSCDGSIFSSQVLVDPYGIVFDSLTNVPLADAKVMLIDITGQGNGGDAGGLAKVYLPDGITPSPNTIITKNDGGYIFPLIAPSTYKLLVIPPDMYLTPSSLPPALLPDDRKIDINASYGKPFIVKSGDPELVVDIPLDQHPPTGLFVEKTASVPTATTGDTIIYKVKLKNSTKLKLTNIILTDNLPKGFKYRVGSSQIDGVATANPTGNTGPKLIYNIGTLIPGQQVIVSYNVRVSLSAGTGNKINSAFATGDSDFGSPVSNIATATVKIIQDAFREEGVIIGKVYVDTNRNRIQDKEEPGIPGVRIYMEDGTFSITDSEGKYSIYGITPRTHVLKVDNTSLPQQSELINLNNRHGGDPGSCFVDMHKYELHKVDFAEGSGNDSVMAEVKLRRERGEWFRDETDKSLQVSLQRDSNIESADIRGRPEKGVVNSGDKLPDINQSIPVADKNNDSFTLPVNKPVKSNFEDIIKELDSKAGFVNLSDGETVSNTQINIQIKGKIGGVFKLCVNGITISDDRIGTRAIINEKEIEILEYIGINLHPGNNFIEMSVWDNFGNIRDEVKINVKAPGKATALRITSNTDNVPADGNSIVEIKVELLDEQGLLITSRMPITLHATAGTWKVKDLNAFETGVQVFIENGYGIYQLIAPDTPANAEVEVENGLMHSKRKISFLPNLRPMIALGVIDGVINLRKLKSDSLLPADIHDGFDDTIDDFANGGKNGGAGMRGALFLKGKVKGEYLLTLGYDSQKESTTRLFRDIQPDEYYPVYGDSSIKGFDAQSTGHIYVKVEHNKSYALYGDFTTTPLNKAQNLGAYNRTFTGFKNSISTEKYDLNLFASRDNLHSQVDEIPANGTSGPYQISTTPTAENSEKIEIITRDRNQPSIIIKSVTQLRFIDYEFEPYTGRLIFRSPVASVDDSLNPVSVRVSYEVIQNSKKFWVTGIDGTLKLTEKISVGGSMVNDANPLDSADLYSGNFTWQPTKNDSLIGEIAKTNRNSIGTGWGKRIDFTHQDALYSLKIYGGITDKGFENSASALSKGRKEAGIKGSLQIDPRKRITSELIHTADNITGGERNGIQVGIEQSFSNNMKIELGSRYAKETTTAASPSSSGATPVDFTSLLAKVTTPLPYTPQATIYGEYECDINNSSKKVAALGGDYQFNNSGRLYARHEFVSSLSGRYALNEIQSQNTTIVGIDTDYIRDGHIFSEYRARDAFAGREAEAAVGLRNQWPIKEGVKLNTGFERIKSLDGKTDTDSTAITGAIEYTANPLWKGTARIEFRNSGNSDNILGTIGYAQKINRDWTWLTKSLYSNMQASTNKTEIGRLQTGLAYRPVDTNKWNVLSKYEIKYQKDNTNTGNTDRIVHIFDIGFNFQPVQRATHSLQYSGKFSAEKSAGAINNTTAHLISAKSTFDITERWDIGATISSLISSGVNGRQYGIGLETGYLVGANCWLSLGYNVMGFHDDDLAENNYTDQGIYLRLRYKFDEDIFSHNDPGINRSINPVNTEKK